VKVLEELLRMPLADKKKAPIGLADVALQVWIDTWGEHTAEQISKLLELLAPHVLADVTSTLVASGMIDAMQLEQALELTYAHDEAKAGTLKRQKSTLYNRTLVKGIRDKEVRASAAQLKPLALASDGVPALKLLCSCSKQWTIPADLISQQMDGIANVGSHPGSLTSVRMYTGPKSESSAQHSQEEASKKVLTLDAAALVALVAEHWGSIATMCAAVDGLLHKLDPATSLWERMLQKYGSRIAAQRALRDFTSSL
jgi:hypothetical protein